MKKLIASACIAGLAMLSAVSGANAASGFSFRDANGKTYTEVNLNSGRTIRLYPTPDRCGGKGRPYDFMGELFNSGGHAYVEAECGSLVRVCVSNGLTLCSTYSRVPVITYRVYDDGF